MGALLSQKLKMKEDEAIFASSSVFVLPATRSSLNALDLASEQAGATETQKRAEHAPPNGGNERGAKAGEHSSPLREAGMNEAQTPLTLPPSRRE